MKFDTARTEDFSGRKRSIVYYDETSSTNTVLFDRVKRGDARRGDVIVAGRQSAGRGRRGRSFLSPDGGIYFSFTANNNTRIAPTVICGSAVASVLENLGYDPEIKWVNDILLGGKKVCGILAETHSEKSLCVIGIGINARAATLPDEISDIACALDAFPAKDISREEMVGSIINEYERLEQLSSDDIITVYKKYLKILSREIVIRETGERCIAVDLTEAGELTVRTDNGEQKNLFSGEISIIKIST